MKNSLAILKTFAIFAFSIFAINSIAYAKNSDNEEKKPVQIEKIVYDAKFSETNKIFVTPKGVGSKDGKSWKSASTLNAALKNAKEFQTILVAKGSYFADPNRKNKKLTFILKNNVRIYGGFDIKTGLRFSDSSIIEGQLNGNANTQQLIYGENLSKNTVLDGFLIQNGKGTADTSKGGGISLKNSNPKLQNLTFQRNEAQFGGAMYNLKSNPTLNKVVFFANNVPSYDPNNDEEDGEDASGGAIYNYESSPTINNTTFNANGANEGGAIYNKNNSNPKISNAIFERNSAKFSGGAIKNYKSNSVINNTKFKSNETGGFGGAIYNYESSPTINNTLFESNLGEEEAGAICNELNSNSNSIINNSTFVSNVTGGIGGAIYNNSNLIISNSIFWKNSGSLKVQKKETGENIFSHKSEENALGLIIKNSILNVNSVHIDNKGDFESAVSYKFMEGENGSKGNKTADPMFVDAKNGNYRLKEGSSAINAGDDSLYPVTMASDKDLDGKPRKVGKIDIGAYEFQK